MEDSSGRKMKYGEQERGRRDKKCREVEFDFTMATISVLNQEAFARNQNPFFSIANPPSGILKRHTFSKSERKYPKIEIIKEKHSSKRIISS